VVRVSGKHRYGRVGPWMEDLDGTGMMVKVRRADAKVDCSRSKA
jgi:hypothetical protein